MERRFSGEYKFVLMWGNAVPGGVTTPINVSSSLESRAWVNTWNLPIFGALKFFVKMGLLFLMYLGDK